MGTITLDDRDAAILECLREGDADVGSLAACVSCPREYLRERLPELADNGLVRRVEDDEYTITEDGERAISGSPAGAMDDRIDTPEDVEAAIESFDLRADREAAVRNAFAFLRYWGEATAAEIVDATYSENPAGYESFEAWWDDCVRDRLAELPRVETPASDGEPWRYAGTATVEQSTADGRLAPDEDVADRASVKYALERSDRSAEERAAVRAAVEYLVWEGDATAADLQDRVYPDHDAGYDDPAEWWTDLVRDGLDSLPGVERAAEGEGAWRYTPTDE